MAYWAKSLSVGIESIDAQHLEFLMLCEQSATVTGSALAHLTHQILRHTIHHFAHEEAVLVASGYHLAAPGDFLLHRQEHRRLKRRIAEMCLRDGPAADLMAALLEHLLRHDMRYANHLRRSGIDLDQGGSIRAACPSAGAVTR